MQPYLLGIDLGAGSLKAVLITAQGEIVGEASHPITTRVPQPGWSEQDPAEWRIALFAAIRACIAHAGIRPGAITGIGISAGAHIPVLTDAQGEVVRPAILWNDQRSAAEAAELHAKAGEQIIATSLNRVNPTWTLCMLAWLQKHEPGRMARVARVYLAKDYLRFCLTGSWETDFSDAVGALLADHASRDWSPELCALIGWDMSRLPPIRPATSVVGTVTPAAAAATGLDRGIPVVCGANDTTAELFGAGAIQPGMGAIKLATAGVLSLVTPGPSVHPPISCYPHIPEGLYYIATGTNSCASAHRWLRDQMFIEGGFAAMDELARSVPPGAEGLLFHPYLQGERAPYWDPLLRADFLGLTIAHGRAHFARALYEGIAFSIRDLLEATRQQGFRFAAMRLLGGGARSPVWRKIIADVTGLTLTCPAAGDASFGAALLAGIGTGLFTGPAQAVEACVRLNAENHPDPEAHRVYGELFDIYKAAQAALAPLNHRLSRLATR